MQARICKYQHHYDADTGMSAACQSIVVADGHLPVVLHQLFHVISATRNATLHLSRTRLFGTHCLHCANLSFRTVGNGSNIHFCITIRYRHYGVSGTLINKQNAMLEINNLSKKYSGKTVLDNICYTFENGKIYGIMGENGAGKSTLFRCIMHLEKFDGDISVSHPHKIGYLSDTPFFYSFVTGMEYIEFCLKASNISIDKQKITALNKKFALPLERYATNYSMGMKKRLMIMTLMLQNYDLVVLDEPFNGLDLAGVILLKQWIKQMKEEGKCIILSSHIISSLTDICDDISYIHNGKTVANFTGKSANEIEMEISKFYLDLTSN